MTQSQMICKSGCNHNADVNLYFSTNLCFDKTSFVTLNHFMILIILCASLKKIKKYVAMYIVFFKNLKTCDMSEAKKYHWDPVDTTFVFN